MKIRKFRDKKTFEASQFITNNESDDANMNALVKWINQGRSIDCDHAWHNGTNIFISRSKENQLKADVGDWICKDNESKPYIYTYEYFVDTYEEV